MRLVLGYQDDSLATLPQITLLNANGVAIASGYTDLDAAVYN